MVTLQHPPATDPAQVIAPGERRDLHPEGSVEGHGRRRDLAANLVWTAKEAASKARREGLRLNVRQATVEAEDLARSAGQWLPLRVVWQEGRADLGWWREDPEWVMAVVSAPGCEAPPGELR